MHRLPRTLQIPDRAPIAPSVPSDAKPTAVARLPASFSDVPNTPELERGLKDLAPGSFEMLEFKLGMLSRLGQCLEGVSLTGKVELEVVYDHPSADGTEASPVSVTLEESDLPVDQDELVLSCLEHALIGHKRRFPPGFAAFPGRGGFGVSFPLEKDSAYYFARTGKWPFKKAR